MTDNPQPTFPPTDTQQTDNGKHAPAHSTFALLVQLWLRRQRREFKWSRVFITAYIYIVFTATVIVAFWTAGEAAERTLARLDDTTWAMIAAIIAVALLPADIIIKLTWKHDTALMDDCLRTKPISRRAWNRFIAATNLANIWNLSVPVLLAPLAFWLMPMRVALPAVAVFYAFSYVDGLAVTVFRKARGWEYKLPVALGWLFGGGIATLYTINLFRIPWGWHLAGYVLMAAGAAVTLYIYMCRLRTYNEEQRKAHRVRSLDRLSAYRMELAGLLRARRLRTTVLLMMILMPLNVYLNAWPDDDGSPPMLLMNLLYYFSIGGVSLSVAAMTFGVEANFFDCLMTKPVSVAQILHQKYRFLALINLPGLLLTLPSAWISDEFSPWQMLALWLFVAGWSNLFALVNCLHTERLDLFSSAFFNYQGTNWSPLVLVNFACIGLYVALFAFLPPQWCAIAAAMLGLLGLTIHRPVIRAIAAAFMARRYKRMEKYR